MLLLFLPLATTNSDSGEFVVKQKGYTTVVDANIRALDPQFVFRGSVLSSILCAASIDATKTSGLSSVSSCSPCQSPDEDVQRCRTIVQAWSAGGDVCYSAFVAPFVSGGQPDRFPRVPLVHNYRGIRRAAALLSALRCRRLGGASVGWGDSPVHFWYF